MLGRGYHLKEERDIIRVKRKGKKYDGPFSSWLVFKREDKGPSRFVIVVSTKISKLAVKRNFIRRTISESIRQSTSFLKPGFDCVILAKPEVVAKYTDEVMRETQTMLKKTGISK